MIDKDKKELVVSSEQREYAGLRALAISSFVLGMINLFGIILLALSIKN